MANTEKTAIIVPCYNEARRLKVQEFTQASQENAFIHFIFVNDGSTDETQEVLSALCCQHPQKMSSIPLATNVGKAEAVRQGFLYAMGTGFDNIGYWDADLSTPLHLIPAFIEKLQDQDVMLVMGSRVMLLGRTISRRATRHYLGRIFATCVSLVLGLNVYDTQCGAKVFRNTDELRRVFASPFLTKWSFDAEILARFLAMERMLRTIPLEHKAIEYPLDQWIHAPGSKIKLMDFPLMGYELLKIAAFLHVPGQQKRYSALLPKLLPEKAALIHEEIKTPNSLSA